MDLTALMNKIQRENDNSMPNGQKPEVYSRKLGAEKHVIIAIIYDGSDRDSQIETVDAWIVKNDTIQEFRASWNSVSSLRYSIGQYYQKFSRTTVRFWEMEITEETSDIIRVKFPISQQYLHGIHLCSREIGNADMKLMAKSDPIPIDNS